MNASNLVKSSLTPDKIALQLVMQVTQDKQTNKYKLCYCVGVDYT